MTEENMFCSPVFIPFDWKNSNNKDEFIEKINKMVGDKNKINTKEELFKYSSIRLKKKRFRKKFLKNVHRYIPEKIYIDYLARVMVVPIMRNSFADVGRKLCSIESLPKCDPLVFTFKEKYEK